MNEDLFKALFRQALGPTFGLSAKTKRNKKGQFQYGTSKRYILARMERDRPDLLKPDKLFKEAKLEFEKSKKVHPEDEPLERLCHAWERADKETRQIFLWLADDDEFLNMPTIQRPKNMGVARSIPVKEIPELEQLIDKEGSVSALAKALGVSYRTVARWRAGEKGLKPKTMEKLTHLINKV